jgi:single-strand DNA-binding protein
MTTICGNLTEVPSVNYTNSGTPVANITVAVNRKERDQEVTDYHDVTLWGSLAENAATLDRGTRVIAVGTIKSRKFQDREGNNRTAWFLDATAFGPELRFATAVVTKTQRGASAPAPRVAEPADSWTSHRTFGDDGQSPF